VDDELIQEQIEYYRERAPEYDETSSPPGDPLALFWQRIEAALAGFAPTGRVLEIASGTGGWTRHLLEQASTITAVDSSSEMHDLSRRKLNNDPRVHYIEADVFTWKPDEQYDVVCFSNWLSHVPPGRFTTFWALVRNALAPGGRVFFTDEGKDAWRNEDFLIDPLVPIVRRPLLDGRTFRAVKVFWDPDELEERLRDLGWDIKIHESGPFLWGEGRPKRAWQ
jgi:SAM-dependent methyltransferase